ncbi:MAG: tRNA pseudouridine(55) synthase TruB [bacterium]|nr:tRNA pseudouridine(55) synthase TruB [bacterium]
MILNVYKEPGMTSRDVVNILSKHFQTKKVGHTGTLDPIASGVLIVCTEKDTKLVDLITAEYKEYVATCKLGLKTDTGDITGNVIEECSYNFKESDLQNVLHSFLGASTQTVPLYSAVKINGKKLYEYARNNIPVTLPVRNINIRDIELLNFSGTEFTFRVVVSKGTYIRSLIEDICASLSTVGTMSALKRTKQGKYRVEDANKIEDILHDKYNLISVLNVLSDYPKVTLDFDLYKKVKNGAKISLNSNDKIVLLVYNNLPVALYEQEDNHYRVYKMLEIS